MLIRVTGYCINSSLLLLGNNNLRLRIWVLHVNNRRLRTGWLSFLRLNICCSVSRPFNDGSLHLVFKSEIRRNDSVKVQCWPMIRKIWVLYSVVSSIFYSSSNRLLLLLLIRIVIHLLFCGYKSAGLISSPQWNGIPYMIQKGPARRFNLRFS